jgi:hypothetical protein
MVVSWVQLNLTKGDYVMPNCFQLTRKGESRPRELEKIDEEICEHLQIPVDPIKWAFEWYNTIGLSLACGQNWDQMRAIFEGEETLRIIDFLEANYVADAWAER